MYKCEVFSLTLAHKQKYPNQRTCAWVEEKLEGPFHPNSTGLCWVISQPNDYFNPEFSSKLLVDQIGQIVKFFGCKIQAGLAGERGRGNEVYIQ